MNQAALKNTGNMTGLYIHIPFCKSKCYYCDFNSFAQIDELIPEYFEAMKKEILYYKGLAETESAEKGSAETETNKIMTVFIGGGTPSYVDPSYLYDLIGLCHSSLSIGDNAEITIESNPGSLTLQKLIAYRRMGINRLSIGLQAWQDRILKGLGRIHNKDVFADNLKEARKAGFDNINADLIFGIPGQEISEWNETVTNMISLEIPHLSCYSLKLEEGTVLYDETQKGLLKPAEDETDREMYHKAVDLLETNGIRRYEISNFSKPGYECRHNLNYWLSGRYIGIGAGAHSYLNNRRYNNVCDVRDYIDSVGNTGVLHENIQEIGRDEEISEYIILGLRLAVGINLTEFKSKFNKDIKMLFGEKLIKLKERRLLEEKNGCLRLSSLGFDLANQVFMEFL